MVVHCCISLQPLITGLLKWLSDDQVSCTSPNSQHFGQATSTNISPQHPSITGTAGNTAPATGQFAINTLPPELLLEIFACYVEDEKSYWQTDRIHSERWHTLARVCRRWRSIALGSPRRLNLRIFCSGIIPARKKLDFWPPFPIDLAVSTEVNSNHYDNILATLEHRDRVCYIRMDRLSNSLWEKVLPLMQKSFPILTGLYIQNAGEILSVAPDVFLGGSAPQLRILSLGGFPFPGLPKLLLSITHLTRLYLHGIPDSGYVAPETMATCLYTLTRLKFLLLSFKLPGLCSASERERRRTYTNPPTRTLLPSLTNFTFNGVSEYLEDFVDRIESPLLDNLEMTFSHRPIFDTRLAQFISRVPKLNTCNEAMMYPSCGGWITSVRLNVLSVSKTTAKAPILSESVEHGHWQPYFHLSPLVQLCTSSFLQALFPMVERLTIIESSSSLRGQDGIERSLWRELLQPFTAVKDLYLFFNVAPPIALVLQELVEESVMELLPVLQNIFLNELQPSEGIGQFVAARQLASRPVSVSRWPGCS